MGVIKDVVLKKIKSKLTVMILKKAAFMAYPPLSWIMSFVFDKLATAILEEGGLFLNYFLINIKTENEAREANEAKAGLKQAIDSGNEEEIAKKNKKFDDKYRELTRLGKRKP